MRPTIVKSRTTFFINNDRCMDVLELVKGVEEVILEVGTWFALIPKTLYWILRHPSKIPAFIDEELAKRKEEQFQGRMSPAIYWLVIVIMPLLAFRKHVNEVVFILFKRAEFVESEEQLIVGLLFCLSFVAAPAIVCNIFSKKSLDKNNVREFLSEQHYLQPVFFAALLVLILLFQKFPSVRLLFKPEASRGLKGNWAPICFWILFVTFFIQEILLIRSSVQCGLWKAIVVLFFSLLLFLVFFYAGIFLLEGMAHVPTGTYSSVDSVSNDL